MSEPLTTQTIARRRHPIRHRSEYLAVLAVRTAVRALPRPCVMWGADRCSQLFHRLDRRRREIALANVKAAFPARSDAACRSIVEGAFRHLGRHVFDLLRFDAMTPEQMLARVEFEGEDRMREARARGRGVVYFCGHFGFWEMQIMVHAVRHDPILMVARTLDNPYLETMIERLRTRVGTRVIGREGAVRRLVRGLRHGESVGMLIDQHLQDRSAVTIDFFGRPASTTSAIAKLALKTGASVLPVFALPLPGGRYRLVYEEPVDAPDPTDPEAVRILTQRCTDVLEGYVRRYPELWLWMHRRWRVDSDDARASLPSTGPRLPATEGRR
ncbi:MAG: lysophospholipid acyltransferase family protein [Acidobacteria bacterium]|nr:lysophospholipid acyltransferase family protein [Acidobacteriota bacterium]